MKLIVGLGNPGSEYERTRHNAGFLAVDRVAKRHAPAGIPRSKFNAMVLEAPIGPPPSGPAGRSGGGGGGGGGAGAAPERCILLKPLTFMNRSGAPVAETLNFYKLSPQEDLLVLVDDYALPLGQIRIRQSGSSGGHNGLADVERALGRSDYPRLRIGVDPPPAAYDDPADWVLGAFTADQLARLDPVLDRVADAVQAFASRGVVAAMNAFNTRDPAGSEKPPPPPRPPP